MAEKFRAVRECWIILAGCDDRVVELCRREWQLSGVRVVAATSGDHLIECVARYSPDCGVVLSVPNLDADALLTADHIRQIDHSCPPAILTSRVQTETAVAAMCSGVSDLLDPEAPAAEIMASLERVFRRRRYEERRGERSMALDSGSLLGNMHVRITLQLGPNILGQDLVNGQPVNAARGLLDFDVAFESAPASPLSSPPGVVFASAESFFDTTTGLPSWRFWPSSRLSGNPILLSNMHTNPNPLLGETRSRSSPPASRSIRTIPTFQRGCTQGWR